MILVFFTNDQVVERRAPKRTYPSIIYHILQIYVGDFGHEWGRGGSPQAHTLGK